MLTILALSCFLDKAKLFTSQYRVTKISVKFIWKIPFNSLD